MKKYNVKADYTTPLVVESFKDKIYSILLDLYIKDKRKINPNYSIQIDNDPNYSKIFSINLKEREVNNWQNFRLQMKYFENNQPNYIVSDLLKFRFQKVWWNDVDLKTYAKFCNNRWEYNNSPIFIYDNDELYFGFYNKQFAIPTFISSTKVKSEETIKEQLLQLSSTTEIKTTNTIKVDKITNLYNICSIVDLHHFYKVVYFKEEPTKLTLVKIGDTNDPADTYKVDLVNCPCSVQDGEFVQPDPRQPAMCWYIDNPMDALGRVTTLEKLTDKVSVMINASDKNAVRRQLYKALKSSLLSEKFEPVLFDNNGNPTLYIGYNNGLEISNTPTKSYEKLLKDKYKDKSEINKAYSKETRYFARNQKFSKKLDEFDSELKEKLIKYLKKHNVSLSNL